ncbi:hypothetical protein AWZ03_001838 [Drosophila navojoa]|uniref:Phorbol-ester/DAG-type domain-containing protein n=1 Tax=Drosophila navojoa TaxID=7232 RepID=A0A484BSL7_DRONA|nr:hypothetical protein AWZ03_001838 [Drosophila navojoa]
MQMAPLRIRIRIRLWGPLPLPLAFAVRRSPVVVLHLPLLGAFGKALSKELFVSKVEPTSPRNERKFSAATAPSMKTKWLKAFKSLKPAGSGSATQADRRNGASNAPSEALRPNLDGSHHLQEYTYKKITACDVCSQILRGHTRQGLRCRICKLNAHGDCAPNLPRCQPKQKLLRRQKSTSELENRVDIEEETADKSVHVPGKTLDVSAAGTGVGAGAGVGVGGGVAAPSAVSQPLQQLQPGLVERTMPVPEIPIVNVPESLAQETHQPSAHQLHQSHQRSLASVAQAAAVRAGRGVRPPPVAMPILGVQLQQQELQQQRGGLPVPTQDISSSSVQRYGTPYAPVSNMSSSAYISSGFGINYYTASALQQQQQQQQQQQLQQQQQSVAAATASFQQQQQASPAHQQLQQQQPPISCSYLQNDPGVRRRLFAGFRPLSGFGRMRQQRSSQQQHRSISLPESNYVTYSQLQQQQQHRQQQQQQQHQHYHHFYHHYPHGNYPDTTFPTPETPFNCLPVTNTDIVRPFGEPLMLTRTILKSPEPSPVDDEAKTQRRVRLDSNSNRN